MFVVVFSCGELGIEVANRLAKTPGVGRVALITAPYRQRRRTLVQQIQHTWKMEGPWMLMDRGFARLVAPFRRSEDGGDPAFGKGLAPSVEHAHFEDFHADDSLHYLGALGADLGVLAGTYIVREAVFSTPRLGSINLHSGKTPEYRGAAPAFWELHNGETEVGITIHRVVAAVDAGTVLIQETFPLDPAPAEDPMEYLTRYRRDVLRPHGVRLLAQAVEAIASGRARDVVQDESKARTYRTPDYRAIRSLRRQVAARRQGGAMSAPTPGLRQRVSSALGRIVYATGLQRVALRDRAVVALFHRVDDRYGDNPISCTVPEFDAYCRFFREHFDVISLAALVKRLETGAPLGGKLVITFDDGYLDNALVASPILRSLGLPACFFIATEFIGSRRVPWWDQEAGIESEWMSWDQVRGLAEAGFELGSHTLNHVDLGVVQGNEAWTEITESAARLEREAGVSVPFFSYPYGRRHQITEANRELVREAGYSCCLSAYGGLVSASANPFDIKRIAISPWYRTPSQFGYEALSARD